MIQDIIPAKKQPQLAEKISKKPAKDESKPGTVAKEEKREKTFYAKLLQENLKEEKPKKKFKIKLPHWKLKLPGFGLRSTSLKRKMILGGIGLCVVAIGGIFVLNIFSSITVEITSRQEFIDVDSAFSASVEPQKNNLPLEVMTVNRKENGSLKSTGSKQISRKANGQIMIYNTYSSEAQLLIKNTRLETPDGKIYRTDKTVTVPGTSVSEGKIIAGEIEATVFADQPGEQYNIGLVDFTVPGFKDPVKREKIYGRSKTEMKSGFVGVMAVITENDINQLQSQLKEKVKDYLLKFGVNPKPDEYLLYDNARQIVFEEIKNGPKPGDEADTLELEENGTLFGFLLKKSDISRLLAEKYFSPEIAPQIELINPEKLSFELKNFTPVSLSFGFKGKAHFAWKIDENKLKNDLVAGRKNPDAVFQKYPAIEKAKTVFKPSWWPFMPKKAGQIAIQQILREEP